MTQLDLCKKVDKILCALYDNRNEGEDYLDISEVFQGGGKSYLIDVEGVREFLENVRDVDVSESDLKLLEEFTCQGSFQNHVDDNWQETVTVSKHNETGHLVGVRTIYSSYGNGEPYADRYELTHCFPVKPIQSWDYL
jgi:hypothetical protein